MTCPFYRGMRSMFQSSKLMYLHAPGNVLGQNTYFLVFLCFLENFQDLPNKSLTYECCIFRNSHFQRFCYKKPTYELNKFFFLHVTFSLLQACSHGIGYSPACTGIVFAIAHVHLLESQCCHPFLLLKHYSSVKQP